MRFEIKLVPKEEQTKLIENSEGRIEAKDYVLLDEGLVYSYYDSPKDAQKDIKQLEQEEQIYQLFCNWVDNTKQQFGISEEQLNRIIKS